MYTLKSIYNGPEPDTDKALGDPLQRLRGHNHCAHGKLHVEQHNYDTK